MLETYVGREDDAVRNDIQRSRAPAINAESRLWFRLARSQDEEPSHGAAIPQFIILYINKAEPRLRGRDRHLPRSRPLADLCSFHGSPILPDVALRIDRHDDFTGDRPTFHAAPVIDRVMAGSDHRNDGGARIIPTKSGGPDKSPPSIGFAAVEIGAYPAGEELRADAAHDGRGAHLIDADPERLGDAWLQRGGNRVRDPVIGAAGAIAGAGGASGILERDRRENDQAGEKRCTGYRRHEASPGIGEARGEPLAELSSRFDGEGTAEPIPANPSSGGARKRLVAEAARRGYPIENRKKSVRRGPRADGKFALNHLPAGANGKSRGSL